MPLSREPGSDSTERTSELFSEYPHMTFPPHVRGSLLIVKRPWSILSGFGSLGLSKTGIPVLNCIANPKTSKCCSTFSENFYASLRRLWAEPRVLDSSRPPTHFAGYRRHRTRIISSECAQSSSHGGTSFISSSGRRLWLLDYVVV